MQTPLEGEKEKKNYANKLAPKHQSIDASVIKASTFSPDYQGSILGRANWCRGLCMSIYLRAEKRAPKHNCSQMQFEEGFRFNHRNGYICKIVNSNALGI